MRNRVFFFGIFFGAVALVAFGRGMDGKSGVTADDGSATLKFSHQKHIVDQGIDCATCHTTAGESTSSSDKLTPGHDVCQTCHEEEVNSKCGYCHTNAENPEALPRPVRELRFNHKAHVTGQKMECVRCHTGLDKTDLATAANMPPMSTCSSCHNNAQAVSQCELCHSNVQTLRPVSHNEGDFTKEHGRLVGLGALDAQCQSCHAQPFCSHCHDGTNLTKLSGKEEIGMISPRVLGNDKSKALAGQMVHDINYRFTHGIDARGRAAECQTCHREQQFCNECHSNGSVALGGVIPSSHDRPDFRPLAVGGVGTGGGLHAELARRDIESCMSCHDVEGADPVCMKCHVDPDGVKGTNPRTHAAGFMKDVEGDWHTDAGATCYACHTDPSARPKPFGVAGVGFCGYCHGKK